MRFPALCSLLLVAEIVLAFPTSLFDRGIHGAAYFISNDPTANHIVSADIKSDGSLEWAGVVLAGGQGAHGVNTPHGPDGLFSQGSIKVAPVGNVLATVNPGSNTVALFSIDSNRPSSIQMIGRPVSSEGQFPMSVAFNPAGTSLCVLNGGRVNGVSCFTVDKTLGLVAKPNTFRSLNVTQTTPPTGPAGTTSQVIFSEDGKRLMASVKGVPPTPGFVAVWDVEADGSLSQEAARIAPPTGGVLPFSLTPIPGTEAFLVTDPGIGFDIFDLSTSSLKGNSSKSSAVKIDGQGATCWSSFSSKTGNYYLTDIGTSIVTEVNVDKDIKAAIIKQYPQKVFSATIDSEVATVGGKDFLYVLSPNVTSVEVLALKGPGKATSFGSYDFTWALEGKGIKVDHNNPQGMAIFLK